MHKFDEMFSQLPGNGQFQFYERARFRAQRAPSTSFPPATARSSIAQTRRRRRSFVRCSPPSSTTTR